MNLIGLDVGFSAKRRSSGVACLQVDQLTIGHATSSWESRAIYLGFDGLADVTAIDAPVLANAECGTRVCERFFTLGSFQRRCKPGLSHIQGTGQRLRHAGRETVRQMSRITSGQKLNMEFPRVWGEHNLVEAFPNAFLGVILPSKCFDVMPKLKRGRKFDWLYYQCSAQQRLEKVVESIGYDGLNGQLPIIQSNQHHDERAALICLLTAAGVATGRYTAVGDKCGGYFFLPPWSAWEEWARQELERQRGDSVEIWIAGRRFNASDALPSDGYHPA